MAGQNKPISNTVIEGWLEDAQEDPYTRDLMKTLILYKESDRGFVIIVASFINDLIEDILLNRMVNSKSSQGKSSDELFGPSGPLFELVSKINLAYRMGFISKTLKSKVDGIAGLRNAHFAHNRKIVRLSSPAVKDKVDAMYGLYPVSELEEALGSSDPKNHRDKFSHFAISVIVELDHIRKQASKP